MNRWQRFFCNVMGWHPSRTWEVVDAGIHPRVRCGRCGYVGLVDSQGNLF